MRRRGLSESDRATWASYSSLVARLPGSAVVEALAEPAPAPAVAAVSPVAPRMPPVRSKPAPLVVGTSPGGVDAATWNRFRQGKLPAVRTLDLHGRTAQRAYAALEQFLHAAMAENVRCVEVITGRGKDGAGVIRREFPFWLNQAHLRPLILAASHPHALNPGSVRLLLKRTRGQGRG